MPVTTPPAMQTACSGFGKSEQEGKWIRALLPAAMPEIRLVRGLRDSFLAKPADI
jgi:hypothetical protein